MKTSHILFLAALVPACGDDAPQDTPDAGGDPDAEETQPDAEPEPDAEPPPIPDPEPIPVRLSATGADGFNGIAFAADGSFYATGYTAATATDRALVVAKFTPDGTLDTTFGNAGVTTVNVAIGGGSAEAARSIAIQSTGKVVIAGIIEHDVLATPPAASDRDGVVVRLDTDGTLDETFDGDGIVILDFNTGFDDGGTWRGADDCRSVAVDSQDRIIVHGGQLTTEAPTGPGLRTDTDWVLVRLTADGALDQTFNGTGKFTFDLLDAGASVRVAVVNPDDSILGTGYSNTTAFNSTQPVIYKVSANGTLDTTWGTSGFFHEAVLLSVTEVYGVARQGEKLITQGYGRDTAEQTTDWVSLRINEDGTQDTAWGDGGKVRIDWHGFGDNGRAITALPGDRVMLVGSGRTSDTNGDAKIVVLEGDGEYDTDFSGDGKFEIDLGGASDAYWNAAVAPDESFVVAVGTRGVGSTQTADLNDDGSLLIFRLE